MLAQNDIMQYSNCKCYPTDFSQYLDEFSLSFAQSVLLLNSTKKYIYALDAVSNRISQNRMIAKGYGENELTNNCADGINCNEEEHQKNRRTEIRILRFDEEGVEIKKE